MRFEKKPPEKTGWYWVQDPPVGSIGKVETYIVQVFDIGNRLMCHAYGYKQPMTLEEMKDWRWWPEELKFPQEQNP